MYIRILHYFLIVATLLSLIQVSSAVDINNPLLQSDEVTNEMIAECQEYASYYWEWYETGIMTAELESCTFSFSVGGNMNPFLPTIGIFNELYAYLLTPDFNILDLIKNDSSIFESFKHHSITGEVITPLMSEEAIAHLLMISNAQTSITYEEDCDLYETMFAGPEEVEISINSEGQMVLVSSIATKKKFSPCPDSNDGEIPDEWSEFWRVLRGAVMYSKLVATQCYISDDQDPGRPGFDCDDFADAMINYLVYTLKDSYPGLTGYPLYLKWCWDGHTFSILEIDGVFWLIDPQTGAIKGPFDSWSAVVSAGWSLLIDEPYNADPYWFQFPNSTKGEPWIQFREPPRWYTDELRRQEVMDCLGILDATPYLPLNVPE